MKCRLNNKVKFGCVTHTCTIHVFMCWLCFMSGALGATHPSVAFGDVVPSVHNFAVLGAATAVSTKLEGCPRQAVATCPSICT